MPEKLENYYKIANPDFEGACKELDTFAMDDDSTVKAQYSPDRQRVKNFLFDNQVWTPDEAEEYVKNHYKVAKTMRTVADIERTKEGYIAIASSEVEDRDGEVISIDGWDLGQFKKNPQLLWMHNRNMAHNGLPIGKVSKIWVGERGGSKKLLFKPEFDDSTEFNRAVKKMVENGLLNSFSVGFLPKERDGNVFTKQILLEISLVPVPANHEATIIQRAKDYGMSQEEVKQFVDRKSAIAYRAYDPAPEGQTWKSGVAIQQMRQRAKSEDTIDFNQYKEGFAWHDVEKADDVSSYKLPHHSVSGDMLVTVWKGVVSAMAVLMGARGGIELSDEDRRKAYEHLASHYKQFGRVAPDYKLVESQELAEVFAIETELLSEKNFKEFKKNLRDIKKHINETKRMEKEAKEQAIKQAELLKVETIKSINEHVSKLFMGANR